MIYLNEKELILVWVKSINSIEFETIELQSCKFKLLITADEWLEENNYKLIGHV